MASALQLALQALLQASEALEQEATDVLFKVNDKLNPAFWDGDALKPEIKERLVAIADDFAASFDYPLQIEDLILTGSSASFNWNRFSDLDLHLVVDYGKIPEKYKPAFLQNADAQRMLWNDEHDIKLHGHEVELYVQPADGTLRAAGVYSLTNDAWVKKPERAEPTASPDEVKHKAAQFRALVTAIESTLAAGQSDLALRAATRLKERIRKYRQSGLEQGGETAAENLVFKTLRNDGTIAKLSDLHSTAYDTVHSTN